MSDTEKQQQLSSEIKAIQQLIEFYWTIPVRDRNEDYHDVINSLNYKVGGLRDEYFKLIPNSN